MRRAERHRVGRLQAAKQSTNAYHKHQYVSAFVEAQSADWSAKSRSRAASSLAFRSEKAARARGSVTSSAAPPTATHPELLALTSELEARYQQSSSSALLANSVESEGRRDSLQPVRHHHRSVGRSAIPFGAWRSNDAAVQHRMDAADFVTHCIIREGKTPAAYGPEAIYRAMPQTVPAVRRLMVFLHDFSSISPAPATAERERIVAAIQRHCRSALDATASSKTTQLYVALFTILDTTRSLGWEVGQILLVWLCREWMRMTTGAVTRQSTATSDLSLLCSIFFETTRWVAPEKGSPTLPQLEELCTTLTEIFRRTPSGDESRGAVALEKRPASSPIWDAVVAAPLLSLVGLAPSRDALSPPLADEPMAVRAFAERFCIQRRSLDSRSYMPAIAWGEYLRALHRSAASLEEIQAMTDAITDAKRTKHADALLRDTSIWNAYLSCTPAAHAMEVYQQNRLHYGLKETPATVAALCNSLLSNLLTAENTQRAAELWDGLRRRRDGKMVVLTCSTALVAIRLYEVEANLAKLLEMVAVFDALFLGFGVPLEWFSRHGGDDLARQWAAAGASMDVEVCRAFFNAACFAHPLCIPAEVRVSLWKAIDRVLAKRAKESELARSDGLPEFSAEDLASFL